MNDRLAFPLGVSQHLKVYVYRLIDPRNGDTFYVGKGQGDRVFQHARGARGGSETDGSDDKIDRIRAIELAGFKVQHVIHRHGLDDATAVEVEAASIDAYPGLKNRQAGHGSQRGIAHAESIISRYAAEDIDFQHDVLMININRTAATEEVYDAVRFAWKVGRRSAERAELVLAIERGLVVGVFKPSIWLDATPQNFSDLDRAEHRPGRLGFVGVEAEPEVASIYLRRKVPDRFRRKGAANPVRYAWLAKRR